MNTEKKTLAHVIVEFLGFGFDPHGGILPTWKAKPKPAVAVPKEDKKPETNARQIPISDYYSEKELEQIAAMDEHEFGRIRSEFGSYKTPEEFIRDYRAKVSNASTQTSTVDFTNEIDVNLTEREYGEMLAYKPPLTDRVFASAIKTELVKRHFKRHKEIVEVLKVRFPDITIQDVKHHSSAFQKALQN